MLATASGFQSAGYRAVEFVLGNKNAGMLQVFAHDAASHTLRAELLEAPSVYDEFLRKALELTFFPELYAVRTEIGSS